MSDEILFDLFLKCINSKTTVVQTTIKCKLNLWSVTSADYRVAMDEAMHYWLQYYEDSEYDTLLIKEEKQNDKTP